MSNHAIRTGHLTRLAALAVAATLLLATGAHAQTLKVGDPAPELYIAKWVQGEPVKSFEKGKVYVIECWATWCGPCVAAIPHLSELNTKFKDKGAVFIGVNVWDQAEVEAIEAFVKEQGASMNYRVAKDEGGREGKTAAAWLQAAGRNGIPCSFVVDKEGKVAWIGHPMGGLEEVVEKILADKFDAKAEAEKSARMEAFPGQFQNAARKGDWDTALKLVDGMLVDAPQAVTSLGAIKFNILLTQLKKTDEAYAFSDGLAASAFKDHAMGLGHLAFIILEEDGVVKRDLDRALAYVSKADELTKHENGQVLTLLARAHQAKGNLEKAIEVQTLAIEKIDDRRQKLHMQNTLEQYKKELAGKTQ
ncbi:MAG: redoxin domain-containing protein [Phycisphaera sp.]|nr:redoxin domain-containing protein [Phycisphaera sp.]